MSKISNAITMLNLLANGKKYSVLELANILEVTPRMVRVYKEELEKAGIYIETIMGPNGGYVLNKTVRLPERKFRKEDYEILDKCLKNNIGIDKEKIEILKDKIKGILSESKKEEEKLSFSSEILERYNILTRAIKQRRKVKILYYSYNKGEMMRVINPIELFLFKDGWYCTAYCELRGDMRHFELKRIKEIELLSDKF